MTIIDELIFDRTQADADKAVSFIDRGWLNLSAAEQQEFSAGMKGAYNASDLNRVGEAITYIAGRFTEYGYATNVSPKTDWQVSDVPTPEQIQAYLQDLANLRSVLSVFPSTPTLPSDMEQFTWGEANNIEKMLFDLETLINNMVAEFIYCGEVYCGEVI